jgi:proteasome regulatory subunit
LSSESNPENAKSEDPVRMYVRHLEQRVRYLELEKRSIESERLKYERENRSLKNELERIRCLPLAVGTLSEILSDDRAVVRTSSGPYFVVSVSKLIDPNVLKPGTRVAMNQRTFAILEVLPPSKDPSVSAMEIEEKPTVTYADIGGLDEQITALKEVVELPLKKPELFKKVGIDPPKGVLLYGLPGTGKTLMAKAVAHESHATFIKVIASELVRKYIGEGARLVREVFELAREKSPAIIFIDELDAVAAKRTDSSTSGDREVQRTLMQLLSELDGFDPRGDVKIIAATNRSDMLDPAIVRPGRFDRHIEVGAPNFDARLQILKIHTAKMNLKDVDLNVIAKTTEDSTGADLKEIATDAGMTAIRDDREYVTHEDFFSALTKMHTSVDLKKEKEAQQMYS